MWPKSWTILRRRKPDCGVGDIIVGFEGETIRGPVGLTRKIHGKKPGDRVTLTVVRDNSRKELDAELGDRTDSWSFLVAPEMPELEAEEFAAQLKDELLSLSEERHGGDDRQGTGPG